MIGRAAGLLLTLAGPILAQEVPRGAQSPERLFEEVRASLLERDWGRFRNLIDRPSFQIQLWELQEDVAILAKEVPSDAREVLARNGFSSFEEFAAADLDRFLDGALPAAYGELLRSIAAEHRLGEIDRDGPASATASFEREGSGYRADAVEREGRWYLAELGGRRFEPPPLENLVAERVKDAVIASFRAAGPGAREIEYRLEPGEPAVPLVLPAAGASTWLPARPIDRLFYKLEIEKATAGGAENLYLVAIYVYRDYDPTKANGGRDDDANEPLRVSAAMVAANE